MRGGRVRHVQPRPDRASDFARDRLTVLPLLHLEGHGATKISGSRRAQCVNLASHDVILASLDVNLPSLDVNLHSPDD